MKFTTPEWWYRRDLSARGGGMPAIRLLLTPLSWIWAAATARRIARGSPIDPGVPVICIGNVTMGGVGKTPVARAIAHRLAQRCMSPHLLSRGYGGRLTSPVRVDASAHASADVGDEPLMLARDFPVWVARDRSAGAIAAAAAGAQVIVMDDGFQNPSVRKTLSILVVDGETRNQEWPFGDGRVFPAGPMREPLGTGLARADAVLILLPADLAEPDPELIAARRGRSCLRPTCAPRPRRRQARRSGSPVSANPGKLRAPSPRPDVISRTLRPLPITSPMTAPCFAAWRIGRPTSKPA